LGRRQRWARADVTGGLGEERGGGGVSEKKKTSCISTGGGVPIGESTRNENKKRFDEISRNQTALQPWINDMVTPTENHPTKTGTGALLMEKKQTSFPTHPGSR